MKKYFLFALLAMFLVGCDQPSVYYPSGDDSDDGGSGNSYVTTRSARDVTHKSATLYGEVNVELSDYDEIEWGVMCSTDKAELESRNAERVFSTDDLLENVYSVSLSDLDAETKYYYCAFVYLNNKQYKFGDTKAFTTLEAPDISGIGVFTISETKQVTFSPGNLQYTQSTNTWSFASTQWKMLGTDNVTGGSVESHPTYGDYKSGTALADKVDLFGWSTAATNFGVSTSTDYNDYYGSFVDWGTNRIGNDAPNTWRTLTYEEWDYLRNGRPNASSLKGVAQVYGVNGVILLPDNWKCPSGVSFKSGFHSNYGVGYAAYQTFTAAEWSKLEAVGAVFLPAAGYRLGSRVRYEQNDGCYWSATEYDSYIAYCLFFYSSRVGMAFDGRDYGYSVRLVKDL